MQTPSNYRRLAFTRRPWITGGLYDILARNTVIHLDAHVFYATTYDFDVLHVEWREGGGLLVAVDMWRIDSNGLTPLDPALEGLGRATIPLYWTSKNREWMARVHQTVLALPDRMLALGAVRWSAVSVLCHYVRVRDTDCEIPAARNYYTERKPYAARVGSASVDVPKRRRGRPRTKLPNWL